MRWFRVAFTFILILSLAPTVTVEPMTASGQSYVTVTTGTTISLTEFYTYSTTTSYETGTASSYIGTYGPTSFDLNVCGLGANAHIKFGAIAGQLYHVEWTNLGNLSLNLYITTGSVSLGEGCNGEGTGPSFPSSTVLFSKNGPVGSVDWVAPSTGQFIAWIFNFNGAAVHVKWSIQSRVATTYSDLNYATAPTTMVTTFTLTSTLSQLGLAALQLLPWAIWGCSLWVPW